MSGQPFFFFFIYKIQTPVTRGWILECAGCGSACTQPTCGLGAVAQAVHQKKQRVHGWREGRDKGSKRKEKNRGSGRFVNYVLSVVDCTAIWSVYLFGSTCRQGCLCFSLCGSHRCIADTGADTWQKQTLYYMPGWLRLTEQVQPPCHANVLKNTL